MHARTCRRERQTLAGGNVTADRVAAGGFGHLNKNDAQAVWVLDPHLDQAPRFLLRLTQHRYPGHLEPHMFGSHVADLEPDRHPWCRRFLRPASHLEETVTEKEHQAPITGIPELAVDRQAKNVPVEPMAALRLTRAQQHPAAEYIHGRDPAVIRSREPFFRA